MADVTRTAVISWKMPVFSGLALDADSDRRRLREPYVFRLLHAGKTMVPGKQSNRLVSPTAIPTKTSWQNTRRVQSPPNRQPVVDVRCREHHLRLRPADAPVSGAGSGHFLGHGAERSGRAAFCLRPRRGIHIRPLLVVLFSEVSSRHRCAQCLGELAARVGVLMAAFPPGSRHSSVLAPAAHRGAERVRMGQPRNLRISRPGRIHVFVLSAGGACRVPPVCRGR